MSHTIFIDESNGNGLFAIKTSASTTSATGANNILPASVSNEDLSQSLSEYTDADESMSAPTEFLAEFLSAVMLKDYKKALKYCKLILQYEPNNATAKEFYPLIQEKLKYDSSSESDENYNKSSSPEIGLDEPCANDSYRSHDDSHGVGVDGGGDDDSSADSNSSSSSVGVGVGAVGGGGSDSEDATSSSDLDENNLDASNSNNSLSVSAGGRSQSDNTTHSYSSLLLEDEDDIVPPILGFTKELSSPDLDISNGNNLKSASCSDSESPTEPLTQRLAAILRSKCIPSNATKDMNAT